MKKRVLAILLATMVLVTAFTGCGTADNDADASAVGADSAVSAEASDQVADASDMAEVIDVVEDGMVPVTAEQIKAGTYDVTVDSSSSMFKIDSAKLTVEDGAMQAVLTMGGTGYLYLFMGTGEEAVKAPESEYIPFEETADGVHTFTVPVEALDAGIDCAAFSKRKEMWYDRTLVFRADSLPADALEEGAVVTAASLELADGTYTVEAALQGGSGKASINSPAELRVQDGQATAVIEWSSSNYDYMLVDGQRYEPVNTEGNSVFEIPAAAFDRPLSVVADTTAMSKPYEIDYTIQLDSSSIQAK